MRSIFISYRRDDAEGQAGRLFEDLCDRFGRAAVFMDVAGIKPGVDFRRAIEAQVASCSVLLAVIGKNWLTVTDDTGHRRLDDPHDFVRLETASALNRDILVIPVLVQGATMPRADQLPDDLKEFSFRNPVEIGHGHWPSDVQLLIEALLPHVGVMPPGPALEPAPSSSPTPAPSGRHTPWVAAPLALLVLGGIGYTAWDRFAPSSTRPAPDAAASEPVGVVAAASTAAPAIVGIAPATTPAPAPATPASAAGGQAAKPVTVEKRAPAPKPVIAAPRAVPGPVVEAPASAPAAAPEPSPISRPAPLPAPSAELLATRDPGTDLFGSPATLAMVTRTIVIKPDARWVNVTGGEVIRFEAGGKSFVWAFNGTRSSFDLALIAPAGLLGRKVTAYVAPNPLQPKKS